MRPLVVRSIVSAALVGAAALPACTDLPTFEPQDRSIATVRISGCSAVAVQSTCTMSGQAWDSEGNVIADPPLVWRSDKPGIASVSGVGSMATVSGIVSGRATISAGDVAGRATDSISILVAPLKHPSE